MKSSHSSIFAAISLLAILMSLIYIPSSEKVAIKPESKPQTYLYFDTTEALLSHYQSSNYQWPINKSTAMPMRLVQSVPKNIHQIKDRSLRKTLFIQIMLPIILAEQKQIQLQRRSLALLIQGNVRNDKIENQLNNLFEEYNIERTLTFNQKGAELLSQYDELPLTLILAQAAIESGWGRSRFAREGNSLFGEWTYSGYGIIPKQREDGKSHRIKSFPSLQNSISSYIKNINRNQAYKELRQDRDVMRANNQSLDARKLAKGLHRYSQKGEAYVVSLLSLLNSEEFKHIEALKLDSRE